MSPVARRYAQALYQQAEASGQTDAVEADVALVGQTFAASPDLVAAIGSPVVPRDKKQAVLGRVFGDGLSPTTAGFLRLLMDKGRESLLPEVVAAYRALGDERTGTVEAVVRAAKPLSADETDRLQAALAARTGKTIRLRIHLDPDLIGGLVVRIGDVVYDRSVQHQLAQLRDSLAERAAVRLN
jgi:F-type H+-transporting ATPase subunit delta